MKDREYYALTQEYGFATERAFPDGASQFYTKHRHCGRYDGKLYP